MIDTRLAIVTGGTRGIGEGISLALAKNGDVVVAVYKSNDARAEEFQKRLQKVSPESTVFKADVSLKSEVDKLVDFVIAEYGRIDILVNNAGMFEFHFLEDMEEDFIDEIMRVNFKSQYLMMRACAKHMKKQKTGRILNASSISGELADVGLIGYGASKAAVNMMTKIAAAELAPYNITVNAYSPGIIHTDLSDQMIRERGHIQVKQIPINRFGSIEETGALARFLASEEAGYITGSIINIDGGFMKVQNPYRAHEYTENRRED